MHNPLVQDPKPSALTKQVHHVQQPALQPFTWIRYSHPMYTDMHMLTTARHGGDSLCTGHEKHMVPMTLTPVYTYKLKSAGTMHAALFSMQHTWTPVFLTCTYRQHCDLCRKYENYCRPYQCLKFACNPALKLNHTFHFCATTEFFSCVASQRLPCTIHKRYNCLYL